MIKSGIMIKQLDMSQLSISMTIALNTLLNDFNHIISTIVFYQTWPQRPFMSRFPLFMEREVWGLNGNVIATDISTAQRLINCPGPKNKFFYIWNLEWALLRNIEYEMLSKVYQNDNLHLIARTDYHAKIIEKLWKKPLFIMDDFNHKILKQIIEYNNV